MTLTQVAYYARRFAPFAILGFLILLIIYYSTRLITIYIESQKPPDIPYETSLGKITLPKISQATSSRGLQLRLDTVTGSSELEESIATAAATVYFLPFQQPRFGYLEKISLIANTLGFQVGRFKKDESGRLFIFEKENEKLTIDNATFNFTYEYDFKNDPEILEGAIAPSRAEGEREAVEFLTKIGRYPEELAQGKINTVFMSYDGENNRVTPLESNIDANIVEIDFYRPDVSEKIPVVSPSFFNSQNYLLLAFYPNEEENPVRILRAQIHFFDKSNEQRGFYPLKSSQQAYAELQEGAGFVISNKSKGNSITIKKIYIAYLDPDVYQEYFQPVYVFLGSNDFVAYVPAVSTDSAASP